MAENSIPLSIMPEPPDANEIRIFESFAAELTDDDDAPPVFACRDAKYYLTIQREKMRALGVSVKEKLKGAGASGRVLGFTIYDGPYYKSRRLCREYIRKSVYSINGRHAYTHRDKENLYQTLINAKNGISGETRCICPSCGGFSKISELERGCKFCGTHFMMSELYPKITGYYWIRGYSFSKSEMGKRYLTYILGGILAGLLLGLILELTGVWKGISEDMNAVGVVAAFYFAFMGGIGGFLFSSFALIGRVFFDAIMTTPLMLRVAGSKKKLADALGPRDPNYFYDAFESRVISLFKIMVYGNNLSENAAYCGETAAPESDIIDAVYRGAMEINRVETRGDFTYVTLSFFANCLHLKNGRRIVRRKDEYKMIIVRNSNVVTDQDFSLIKVECPPCGGSFDATRTKRCPYCGTDYRLFDHDWAVYSFRKV